MIEPIVKTFEQASELDPALQSFSQGDITEIGVNEKSNALLYFQTPYNLFFDQNLKTVTAQFAIFTLTHTEKGKAKVKDAIDNDFAPEIVKTDTGGQPVIDFATIAETDEMLLAIGRALSYLLFRLDQNQIPGAMANAFRIINLQSYHNYRHVNYAGYRAEFEVKFRNTIVSKCNPYEC